MTAPPDNNEFPTISGFDKGRIWPNNESIDPSEIAAGDRIGDFAIFEEVGRGGMGVVYKAYETSLKRVVALKVLNPSIANDPSLIKRFRREAVLAANLSHPNIVPVFTIDGGERPRYFTMEFVQGISLKNKLERDGFLDPDQAVRIALQICAAIQCAHNHNIIHRDIKPSNVLLENHIERVRVTDFGIAHEISGKLGDLTESGVSTPGTPAFESPEQNLSQSLDVRTDIFSLGMTLYYMLTGRVAYTAKNHAELAIAFRDQKPFSPSHFNTDVTKTLDKIVMKMIAVNKVKRYKNVAQLIDALLTAIPEKSGITEVPPDETDVNPGVGTGSISKTSAPERNVMRIVMKVTTVCLIAVAGLAILFLKYSAPIPTPLPSPSKSHDDTPVSQAPTISALSNGAAKKQSTVNPVPVSSLSIEKWIETAGGIGGIAVSPNGENVYAAYWSNKTGSPIEEYSLKSGEKLRVFPYDDRHCHGDVIISKDGRYLYTNNYGYTHMSRLDLQLNGKETPCEVGGVRNDVWAGNLDASPDGKLLLIEVGRDGRNYDMHNDQISILDITKDNLELIGEVKLLDEPAGHKIGFSEDSRFAYVITYPRQSKSARLYEIRLEKPFGVVRSVEFKGGTLESVAVHDGQGKVFVSDSANKKIWVVNKTDFKVQRGISLEGCAPGTLLLPAKSDILYALSPTTRSLWCIDAKTDNALNQLKGLRRGARDIEITPDSSRLLISHGSEDGGICIIRLPSNAVASRSPTDDRIVFSSDREGNYQIFSMHANGEDLTRLTKSNAMEKSPRWSPDGERIAFIGDRDGPPRIYIMRKDGTDVQALNTTDPAFGDTNSGVPLDWSPDGTKLVFVNAKHTAIRIIDADGTGVRTLIEGAISHGYGRFNGVGWRWEKNCILFNTQNPAWGYDQDIFSFNPESNKLVQITDEWGAYAHCMAPAMSPDGKQIAVLRQTERDPPPRNIFVMSRAGNNFINLTGTAQIDATPRWSPDGKQIVFCSGTLGKKHIWIMNADGSSQVQLTSGDSDDVEPDIH